MEENTETRPQEPLGVLFETINYYSNDDLESFIKNIDDKQALYCLIQGVRSAYSRGIYSLTESEIISKSLRKLTTDG